MRIVKLEAENVKRLRAVSISPNGAVVRIQGANGAGKTSVLDSIAYALGGERLCPIEPIRRGAEKAHVTVELDDGLVVERRWTRGGTRLEVRTKEGAKFPSPQKMLDTLVGRLSFDPLAFLRLPPKEQAEALRQLAGVDFSLLDTKRRTAYDARTLANRQVSQCKARLSAIPEIDAPDQPVSGSELLAEHARRQEVRSRNQTRRAELERTRERAQRALRAVEESQARIKRLEEELERERGVLAERQSDVETIKAAGVALRAEVDALVDPDLDEIAAQLRDLEATNERIRQKQKRSAAVAELQAAETEAKRLDDEIAGIDRQKAEALAQAKFPVPGLAFDEQGVTFNGLPFAQSSAAEQLRVSVAMAVAMNSRLRVMLIRDGSLLDAKSLTLIAEMAEQNDCQVWLEQVSTGDGCGILIEDGEVRGEVPAATSTAPATEACAS